MLKNSELKALYNIKIEIRSFKDPSETFFPKCLNVLKKSMLEALNDLRKQSHKLQVKNTFKIR